MDDFQQDEPQEVQEAITDSAPVEEVSEQAEAPEQEQEQKVTFDERQQAKVNDIIGQHVAKRREEERRRQELEQKLSDIESQLPKQNDIDVPPLPNPDDYYGDEQGFREAIQAREEAIAKRAEVQALTLAQERQAQEIAYRQQLEAQAEAQQKVASYVKSAKEFGISEDQAQKDGAAVAQYIGGDVQDVIVSDPQGALISSYLAKNVIELDHLSRMTPMQQAVYIATEVKPKISSTRKTTQAPKPVDIVEGAGAPTQEPAILQGAEWK